MGKNVYAAPRKGPAGKWVEPAAGRRPDFQESQRARRERIASLAERYRQGGRQQENGRRAAEEDEEQ